MMENNPTPSPDPVPEASPIAVPVPAESAVTPPPAPPVIPLRERPNAPLLHKRFQNLFRLGIANIVINLLNNTFKLGDKIPSLGIVLSAMSFAVSVLALVVLWKLSAAVPRFRKAVYFNLLPLIALPFVALLDAPSVQEWITASDVSAILVVLIILLGLIFLFATLAAYHQLIACAVFEHRYALCAQQVLFPLPRVRAHVDRDPVAERRAHDADAQAQITRRADVQLILREKVAERARGKHAVIIAHLDQPVRKR